MKGFRPPARIAPDRELLLASGWFLALALLVAGPLLGRGYLLLLDFAAGPHFAKLDPLPLPSSGDLGNEVPLFAVQRLLAAIYQPFVPRALLVFPIVLGGVGVYRLTRRLLGIGTLPALAGGTLYMINPFMRDRYLAGHLYFVLGCSLLPWALLPLYDAARRPTTRRAATVAQRKRKRPHPGRQPTLRLHPGARHGRRSAFSAGGDAGPGRGRRECDLYGVCP